MQEKMKLYSVEMTETELRLFSEFLGQKEFDYHDDVEDSIRKATRGELSEDEAFISARKSWINDSRIIENTAKKSLDKAKKDPTDENLGLLIHDENRLSDYLKNHEEIVEKKQEDLMNLNDISKDLKKKQEKDLFKSVNSGDKAKINENVPIITEEPEEDSDSLNLVDRVRRDQEMKSELPDKLPERPIYIKEPKTLEKPENWKEKAVKGMNHVKERATDLYRDSAEKYREFSGGRSLRKDSAIAAGVTAGLGVGAYALHKHLKNKKKEKELVKDKYKTDSDKKKEDKKKK